MTNLVIEYDGDKHMVSATEAEIRNRSIPILLYPGTNQSKFVYVSSWFEEGYEIRPCSKSDIYYNSVRLLD